MSTRGAENQPRWTEEHRSSVKEIQNGNPKKTWVELRSEEQRLSNQAVIVRSLNSGPDCQPGTDVADVAMWYRCGRSGSCTPVGPQQKPRSQRHLREEPGRLPD